MPKKIALVLSIIIFLSIATFYSFDIGGSRHEFFSNLLYLLPPLLAVIAGFIATKSYELDNPRGQSTGLMTAGITAIFIGEFIWFILRSIIGTDPYPSIADAFYLAGYPLLFAGLVVEIKSQNFSLRSVNQFSKVLMIMLTGLMSFIVLYFGVFLAYKPEAGLTSNLIAMSYGIGDLILIFPTLLALKLALDYGKGSLAQPWLFLLGGFILMLIADILFAIYPDQYQAFTKPYHYIDLFWALSYLCFAYGFYGFHDAIKQIQERMKK